ncbi:MAG: TetR/AcrR family transcriptional regulator [Cyanobacteriota bacterium]|nr:TetR/AcrR family transcriptional regulator [Cyanobacteriota bacterium]
MMTKRQQNALKTRQKLIDTTENLLKKDGFNALSVEDITNASGVAKGTFYVYFKHKEDIVTEICRGYFKQIENDLSQMKSDNIIEKLTIYFDHFMKAVELYGINICREWIKDVIDPQNENVDHGKWQYDFGMLKNILNTAVKNNELKEDTPVELLTHIIITQLYGMMTVWCVSDGVFEPTEWTQKFSRFQLKRLIGEYLI